MIPIYTHCCGDDCYQMGDPASAFYVPPKVLDELNKHMDSDMTAAASTTAFTPDFDDLIAFMKKHPPPPKRESFLEPIKMDPPEFKDEDFKFRVHMDYWPTFKQPKHVLYSHADCPPPRMCTRCGGRGRVKIRPHGRMECFMCHGRGWK